MASATTRRMEKVSNASLPEGYVRSSVCKDRSMGFPPGHDVVRARGGVQPSALSVRLISRGEDALARGGGGVVPWVGGRSPSVEASL